MSARVIPLIRPLPNTARARLERAIALSVEMRALLAPGFPISSDLIAGAEDRLAGVEVGMRSLLAVLNSQPGAA